MCLFKMSKWFWIIHRGNLKQGKGVTITVRQRGDRKMARELQ